MSTQRASDSTEAWGRYERQLAMFRKRSRPLAAAAAALAELLEEPNVLAIGRLMEMFGAEPVQAMAVTARERFDAARAQGSSAYVAQPNGSDVATFQGIPRSAGGVFFFLMRAHLSSLGINWSGLFIPGLPRDPATAASAMQQSVASRSERVAATEDQAPRSMPAAQPGNLAGISAVGSATSDQDNKPVTENKAVGAKPSRLKATAVGVPVGEPRKTDQPGVLQLVFDVEMSTSMPKGLPTLGRSRIVVLCSEKQYRQAVPNGVPDGRLVAEGEAAATSSPAGKPLLVLVCTRLTSLESDQAKQQAAPKSESS